MRLERSALISAACAAALGCAGTASASPPAPYSYSGVCDDAILFVPVDAANVRPYLPRGYVALGDEGGQSDKAILGVTVCKSGPLTLDGQPLPPALFNDVMVPINAPPDCGKVAGGCDGAHFYVLWQTGTSRAVHERQAALGEHGAFVRDMTFDDVPGMVGGTIAVTMPWRVSPFSGDYSYTGVATAGIPSSNTFWQVTRAGAVLRITTQFTDQELTRPVEGALHAAAGTPLARILGSTEATAPGSYAHFEFTQSGETWIPAPRGAASQTTGGGRNEHHSNRRGQARGLHGPGRYGHGRHHQRAAVRHR
jgi:hypothetical protein